ncbi:MAG: multidrug transporter [Desulfobacteraceae bacterium]|nr:multidrug transporter [Desulfobacteraceae bacterium]
MGGQFWTLFDTYIRIETFASIFSTIVQFLILVLITIKKEKYLYAILGLQMFLTIISDTFLVSPLPISMNLGVNGIAISNILVNVFLLIMAIGFLNREGYHINFKEKISFGWMKEWLKVGSFSGLESFVRNIAFMLMIVRMINIVGEQGTFWVANNFIWGWLLLPILQLGQLIKRDCGESGDDAINQKTIGYFVLTGIIVSIWIVTIPFWETFIKNVMNIKNYMDVYRIAIISMTFYITFAFNNVIDSIFYGIGKTNYMLFQSLVINTVFYGTLYILYTMGIYKPTLDLIVLMFAAGIALDSILTYGMFVWMLKKRKIRILDFRKNLNPYVPG